MGVVGGVRRLSGGSGEAVRRLPPFQKGRSAVGGVQRLAREAASSWTPFAREEDLTLGEGAKASVSDGGFVRSEGPTAQQTIRLRRGRVQKGLRESGRLRPFVHLRGRTAAQRGNRLHRKGALRGLRKAAAELLKRGQLQRENNEKFGGRTVTRKTADEVSVKAKAKKALRLV